MEGERVCPRLWGHTKKHGVPHASWRWSQGQRPAPPCGTPPRARRRPAAADGGGSCLSPSPRPDRCRRRPACGQQGARPAARRGVGEASGSVGTAGYGEALAGMPREKGLYISYTPTGKGALYFLYSQYTSIPGALLANTRAYPMHFIALVACIEGSHKPLCAPGNTVSNTHLLCKPETLICETSF